MVKDSDWLTVGAHEMYASGPASSGDFSTDEAI